MTEEVSEDKAQTSDQASDVPSDDGASQTVKHKFTFSFDVVAEAPRVVTELENISCSDGSTAVLQCVITGEPVPDVSWCYNNIPHNNKKYLHSSDGDNHFLKICKVGPQDSGVYTCRAINVVGETLCRASLVVLNAKTFSGKTRGRELTAVSLGSAKVQPQKFDLMVGNTSFDGEQVSEIDEQGEKYVSINFDVFAEPAKDDKVTETPPRCVIPLTNVTAAVGTPVILQCLVNGKPNPTAEWFKDGDRITDSRCIIQEKTEGHFNLLITNVTQSDAGEYKCVIQNPSGCIETAALLKVL
uniref:Ig-like domain-containing protein n=1 Tax=Amphiprion percula TaxID=161767 RepID=A0A3P8STS8_AMPPE